MGFWNGTVWNAVKGSTNAIIQAAGDVAVNLGQSAVHALMPDDYEYYLCSFELYNSKLEQKGFLSFVVMPDQISESWTPIQNLVKTHGGIVTVFNPSFAPRDITISGSFGRKWRIVTQIKDPVEKKGNNSGFFSLNVGAIFGTTYNIALKSGYGLIKILQHILQKSVDTDEEGGAYFLVFNNYALNTSYVVNVVNCQFNQSIEQNMIWNYNIALKAVGHKPKLNSGGSLWAGLCSVASNSIANGLTNIVTTMIGF